MMLRLGKFLAVGGLGLLLSMASAQAAVVSLENEREAGGVTTWDVVYDPDGAEGVASLQQHIGIAGDVGNISDVSGTDSGAPAWTVRGFSDLGAEIIYGGVNFNADTPTPGPVVLGTFSVTWNGQGSVEIVNVKSDYFGFGPPAFELSDTTPAILASLPAGGPCDDLGGDTDGDTVCDDEDPCMHFANTLPLVISNFVGIPDECFCGDFDNNHTLTGGDAQAINQCAGFVRFDCDLTRDDVDGNGVLTGNDAARVNRVAGFLDPAYKLTCSRRPEGTCGGATGVSCF